MMRDSNAHLEVLDAAEPTFGCPDLDSFCLVDRPGLTDTAQHVGADQSVLACRVVEAEHVSERSCWAPAVVSGAIRDTALRRLAHVPVGWRPTLLQVFPAGHDVRRALRKNGGTFVSLRPRFSASSTLRPDSAQACRASVPPHGGLRLGRTHHPALSGCVVPHVRGAERAPFGLSTGLGGGNTRPGRCRSLCLWFVSRRLPPRPTPGRRPW